MRKRSVAAVTSILQQDCDDGGDEESPYEEIEERVRIHALSDPIAARIAARTPCAITKPS